MFDEAFLLVRHWRLLVRTRRAFSAVSQSVFLHADACFSEIKS